MKFINSIEELKALYENSGMSELALQQLLNNGTKCCKYNVYDKLKGDLSYQKAKILVKLWKEQILYEIY